MPGHTKIIHKFRKDIDGIGWYEFIIYLDKNKGHFFADVPEKELKPKQSGVILKDQAFDVVIKKGFVVDNEYNKLLVKIDDSIRLFEEFNIKFERFILIKLETYTSFKDGSGTGIHFNWGVFRFYENDKIILESNNLEGKERGIYHQYYKDWKKLPYKDELVDFLTSIDEKLIQLKENLEDLILNNKIDLKLLE
jgi:antitoxin component YwqK of YwqJK toxin-antitoxin module